MSLIAIYLITKLIFFIYRKLQNLSGEKAIANALVMASGAPAAALPSAEA